MDSVSSADLHLIVQERSFARIPAEVSGMTFSETPFIVIKKNNCLNDGGILWY